MVAANEWNPELEEREEEQGGPKILGVSLKDPRFMGGAIGMIGLGIAGFLGYNQLKPAIEKSAELKAEIKSAKNLTQQEIDNITQELSNNFKSEIKLNYTHDLSLIGGLVVQIGSTMIDTSIKKKLQQLETRMIEA